MQPAGLALRPWLKSLMDRIDFIGWSASKEFAAAGYNLCLRRSQMLQVCNYCRSNSMFLKVVPDLLELSPKDMVMAAVASGEASSIRAALRSKNIDTRVKKVLRTMHLAQSKVEGSEAEREVLRFKMGALRLWTGCSTLFFTLNPHDIHTPLLVCFAGEKDESIEKISLDWDDETMAAYYDRSRGGNALRFHELAANWPAAAARCVHWTFEHTLTALFNVAPPANRSFFQLAHPITFAHPLEIPPSRPGGM